MKAFSGNTRYPLLQWLLLTVFLLSGAGAQAHLAGMTDTAVEIAQPGVRILFTTAQDNLRELGAAATDAEQAAMILDGFTVRSDEQVCAGRLQKQRTLSRIESHQIELIYLCEHPGRIRIDYRLFSGADTHENFVRIRMAGHVQSRTLTDTHRQLDYDIPALLVEWNGQLAADFSSEDMNANLQTSNMAYLPLGIEHILLGWDHLLFLLGLVLIPARLRSVVLIATSFTLAHSLTLVAATLEWISLPPLLVEWLIAFSIAAIALENLWYLRHGARLTGAERAHYFARLQRRRLLITFCFGLIHGFGFSSVLREIGLGASQIWSLGLFNLGVELGQIIAIALVWPLLILIFRKDHGVKLAAVTSVAVAVMGGYLMVVRALV